MSLPTANLRRLAASLLFGAGLGVALGVAPAAACGYYGCYAAAPVVVQPYYSSCSCCGCGGYAGYGYGYGYGYPAYYGAYAAYDEAVVAATPYYPRWRHRCWGPYRGC